MRANLVGTGLLISKLQGFAPKMQRFGVLTMIVTL
jgi:hypothetical protein